MAGAEGEGLCKRAKLLSCLHGTDSHRPRFPWAMQTSPCIYSISGGSCLRCWYLLRAVLGLCSMAVFVLLNASWESSDVAEA